MSRFAKRADSPRLHHHQHRPRSGEIPSSHQTLLLQQSTAEAEIHASCDIHASAGQQARGGGEAQG